MATSYRQFLIELYQEHLEEASFLYEQRLGLFGDPEITWLDIAEFEDRLEAHIDALVVGEDLALEICKIQGEEGDFGEFYAALAVFCRQDRKDLVLSLLQALDRDDVERVGAVYNALKDELPASWVPVVSRFLVEGDRRFAGLFAKVLGYRRLNPNGAILLDNPNLIPSEQLEDVIWAIGRMGGPQAAPMLSPYLEHSDERICNSAAMALLRLGDRQALRHCRDSFRREGSMVLPLALSGGATSVRMLLDRINTADAYSDQILALGLLGDVAVIPVLIESLAVPETALAASTAVQAITGAGLHEEVFVPEDFDEDELFEEELERFKATGELPTRPGGEPFGENIQRLSQNPEQWKAWLDKSQSRFRPRLRYRNGLPYSPHALLQTLISEHSPYRLRRLACDELTTRYGVDFGLEADMRVVDQRRIIANIERWVQESTDRFAPGKWSFAGQPID